MYKIEILNDYNDDKFRQLKKLIEEFAINVFMIQKFNLANKSNNEKINYIKNYKELLSKEEIKYLQNDINERIKFAISSINEKSKCKSTRYYILLENENIVAFQTAQVRKENNNIEGWRNFAYTKDNYKGKIGNVVTTYGNFKNGILSDIIYENISEWFDEENVKIERTATGKNMYKNIKLYIIKKGFIPEKIDENRIYLMKKYNNKKTKSELIKIYKDTISNLN